MPTGGKLSCEPDGPLGDPRSQRAVAPPGCGLGDGFEVRSIRFRKVTKVAASLFTQRIGCFPISADQVDVLLQWLQQAKPEVERAKQK